MTFFFQYFYIVPCITALLIAFLSYFRSKRHRSVVRFAILNLTVAGWNFGEFCKNFTDEPDSTKFCIKFSLASATLMFSTCFHFILRYIGNKSRRGQILLRVFYGISILLIVSLFHPTIFLKGVVPGPWGLLAVPGPLYYLFVASYVLVFVYAFGMLAQYARHIDNRIERNRVCYILFYGCLAVFMGISHFVHIAGLIVPPLGHLGTFIFSIAMFFAIFRYQIMDIRLALRKTLLLTASISILTALYLILVLSSEKIIFYFTGQRSTLVTYLTVMVFALLFQPFQKRIQDFGDRLLFPVRYFYRNVLENFGKRINSFGSVDSLSKALVESLHRSMTFEEVAMYCWNPDFQNFNLAYCMPCENHSLPRNQAAPPCQSEVLILQDITRRMRVEILDKSEYENLADQAQYLRDLQMEVLVPIYLNEKSLGFLLLGQKKTYTIIDHEDVEILLSIAARTATALSNIMAEQRARQAEHLAQVGKLSATIAHEIKNPLGAIQSSAQLLRDGKGSNVQLDVILEESERLNRVLMEYLDFSRPAKLELEKIEWNQYLEKAIKLLGTPDENVEFIRSTEPVKVLIDFDKMRQVLVNVFGNAVRTTGKQGRITLRAFCDTHWAGIAIEDNGPGFSDEALCRALEPFYTTYENGTGLGLAISKKIVEDHKGVLGIGNREQGGARVEIRIPRA